VVLHTCEIIENKAVSENIFSMTLQSEDICGRFRPGQFVAIGMRTEGVYRLRRPFSIAKCDDGLFTILYQCVGPATRAMAQLAPGTAADITGPLGNGFTTGEEQRVLLVAGGIGAASLLALAEHYAQKQRAKITLLFGSRSSSELSVKRFFEAIDLDIHTATDDGSEGLHGYVTDLLGEHLSRHEKPDTVFACGPKPMLKLTAEQSRLHGIPSQLCLEEYMACGLGVCMGCVQKTFVDGVEKYLRVCKEGPVFNGDDICWDEV